MINRTDALAQLENFSRNPDATPLTPIIVKQARGIIECLFGERERMSQTEADLAQLILTVTNTAFVAALRAALDAGDADDDDPSESQ